MSQTFDLEDLGIPDGSEYHRMVGRCPGAGLLRFENGEALIEEGADSSEIFIVLRGSYRVERPETKHKTHHAAEPLAAVDVSDPGTPSFVGEMAYLGGGVRSATVRCTAPTYAVRLSPENLDIITEEFPLLTRILCRQFATRLRETSATLLESQRMDSIDWIDLALDTGDVLFTRGQRADTLYQLADGVLARDVEGTDEIIERDSLFMNFLDPLPYFQDGNYPCTVEAVAPSRLLAFPKESKVALTRRIPDLVLHCLRLAHPAS